MNILFIGDIYGRPGRNLITSELFSLRNEFFIDMVIANGENLAHGKGITKRTGTEMFDAGIDVFTSGNHLWDKKESFNYLNEEKRILKPLNYSKNAPGNDFYIFTTSNGEKIGVMNFAGQAFMPPTNSPFERFDEIYPKIKEYTDLILVDFHAEATAEKRAFGFYLDGKVSAVFGTHTHIQTADEEILPNGTAYITDAGMTGSHDSVIGVKKGIILKKITEGIPVKYEMAEKGLQINGVIVEIIKGKVEKVFRLKRHYE